MARSTQDTDQPRRIVIRPYPFDSSIASGLVAALDHEVGVELYPDFDDANHPTKQQAAKSGESFDKNPRPQVSAGGYAPSSDPDGRAKAHAVFEDLTSEQVNALHFHVAFDSTGVSSIPREADLPAQDLALTSSADTGIPVGCIGLKLLPYFPHHEPQFSTSASVVASHPRYAEIKRFYVVQSHRSVPVILFDSTQSHIKALQQGRVATSLLTAAIKYAKEVLHVDTLVLEVGFRQKAAVKLYERMGWWRREVFGAYIGEGVESGGVSMCYELNLGENGVASEWVAGAGPAHNVVQGGRQDSVYLQQNQT